MTVESAIRALAGFFVMASVALGYWVHPGFFLFTAFVGANLFQSGLHQHLPGDGRLPEAGPARRGCAGAEVKPFPEAEAAFAAAHPEYGRTGAIDELRRRDFARLDAVGHVYLDYTGSGLYAESQVRRHAELLLGHGARQPALGEPDLRREHAPRRAAAAGACSSSSAPTRTSTRWSSPPTPARR